MDSIFAAKTFEGMSGSATFTDLPLRSVTCDSFTMPILSRSWR